MMIPRTCSICGKVFTACSTRHKYCGDDCRKVATKTWERERCRREKEARERKKKNARTIGEISAAAKKAGMTYGEYVAKFGV